MDQELAASPYSEAAILTRGDEAMIVTNIDFQNNVSKYLALVSQEDIVITCEGNQIARLIGLDKNTSFLSDSLVGIIPSDIDLQKERNERLKRQ